MKPDAIIREHLVELLSGGGAHLTFQDAVADWPPELRGAKVSSCPHTAWRLIEHMRIAQWDILEFTRNPKHISPDWPVGYWPETDAPPTPEAWDKCIAAFEADLEAMMEIVEDPKTDLTQRLPHGDGQTVFREALLVADHNAYHLGQLTVLRRALGDWDD